MATLRNGYRQTHDQQQEQQYFPYNQEYSNAAPTTSTSTSTTFSNLSQKINKKIEKNMFHLPNKFLGFFPIYYGIEIGLGITIINKFCGMYGILALFSGHALSFMQWIFYLFQFFTLLIYSKALSQVYEPHLVYYSFTLLTFICDTFFTLFFTIFFTAEWYGGASSVTANSGNSGTYQRWLSIRDTADVAVAAAAAAAVAPTDPQSSSSASSVGSAAASLSYEYFSTVFIIILGVTGRLYINFLLLSFVKKLFQTPKYIIDENDEVNDVSLNLKNKNYFTQYMYKVQKKCYNFCKKILQ